MATPEQGSASPIFPPLLQPIESWEDMPALNVYPVVEDHTAKDEVIASLAVTGVPDYDSVGRQQQYLERRLLPPDLEGLAAYRSDTGFGIPYPTLYSSGARAARADRMRWWIDPKTAAAATLLSAAAFNIQPVAQGATFGVQWAAHGIYRLLHPVRSTEVNVPTEEPGKLVPKNFSDDARMLDRSGSAVVDPASIWWFAVGVANAEKGDNPITVAFQGRASDEYAKYGDAAIGRPDAENAALEEERARAAEAQFRTDMGILHEPVPPITTVTHEFVIPPGLKGQLVHEAAVDGFDSLTAAIQAEDAGDPVPHPLAGEIQGDFQGTRGVLMVGAYSEEVASPPIVVDVPTHMPGKDNPPKPGPFHWRWFIPVPPIPRSRRREDQPRHHLGIGYLPLRRSKEKDPDMETVLVRLRKDAIISPDGVYNEGDEDNSGKRYLAPVPFALTRKAMHLGREGLYDSVLQANYTNPVTGAQSETVRMLFIGHHPSEAAVERYGKILQRVAAANMRKLGKTISIINVFPSKDAGIDEEDEEDEDPTRIGLGIDHQTRDKNVLGETIGELEIIEMHAPDLDNPDKIDEIFNDIEGAEWVTAHEAIHGATFKSGPTRVKRIRNSPVPNAHVIVGSRRLRNPLGRRINRNVKPLVASETGLSSTRFRAQLPNDRRPGKTRTRRIWGNDPRMNQAMQLEIIGRRHTGYSGTSPREHIAESGAQALTGILAEVEQEFRVPVTMGAKPRRYAPDRRVQRRTAKVLGTHARGGSAVHIPGSENISINYVENPEEDELIRTIMQSVRSHEFPEPEDMIPILVRVARIRRAAREAADS